MASAMQTELPQDGVERQTANCPLASSFSRRYGWLLTAGAVMLVAATGWIFWYFHPEPLPPFKDTSMPIAEIKNGRVRIRMPNGNLVGMVGSYPDELGAYLRLKYLEGLKPLAASTALIAVTEKDSGPEYKIYILLENDLLSQTARLARLQSDGYVDAFETESPPTSQIEAWRQQTQVFEAAYQRPVQKRLLQLPRKVLTTVVARFILFKVRTDRRVRERIEPAIDKAPSAKAAHQFAADMIDVAAFYRIPLATMLGIGAMENNYLNVRGDLHHTVWKKHASNGDIVLKRRRGRVLVKDYALGRWQITLQTLRYVHSLYLSDKRDYSELPERLRPPRILDVDQVDTDVLTTYAGLLLRKLIDYFDGDIVKAQGAYNGGPSRPNLRYSKGVSMVSEYAHRVLSVAAGRQSATVAETPLKVVKR